MALPERPCAAGAVVPAVDIALHPAQLRRGIVPPERAIDGHLAARQCLGDAPGGTVGRVPTPKAALLVDDALDAGELLAEDGLGVADRILLTRPEPAAGVRMETNLSFPDVDGFASVGDLPPLGLALNRPDLDVGAHFQEAHLSRGAGRLRSADSVPFDDGTRRHRPDGRGGDDGADGSVGGNRRTDKQSHGHRQRHQNPTHESSKSFGVSHWRPSFPTHVICRSRYLQ